MPGFTSRIGAVYHAFSEYRARRHAIYALDSMDDDMLKDIGLSRSAIPSAVHAKRRAGHGPAD